MKKTPLFKVSFSIADIPLGVSIESLFAVARDLKTDGVEILPGFRTFPHLKKLKELISKYNVDILSVHQPLYTGFGVISEEIAIGLAHYFQAKYVMHPFSKYALNSIEAENYFYYMQKLLRRYNVKGFLENMPFTYSLPLVSQIQKRPHLSNTNLSALRKTCNEYGFGMTFDTTHCMQSDLTTVAGLQEALPLIGNIHLSDYSGRQHLPLGNGKVDIGKFLTFLRKNNYSELVTLELSPRIFCPKGEYLRGLESSIKIVQGYTK